MQATVGATFAAGAFEAAPTQIGSSMSLAVSSDYVSSLGDINGDGVLTPAEIAADPEAAALAEQLRATICAQMGLSDCSMIQITGMNTGQGSLASGLDVNVADAYHDQIMLADTDGDGNVSAEEMAANADAAALAAALQTSICDSLGDACTDPSTIQIDGVASGGRRR